MYIQYAYSGAGIFSGLSKFKSDNLPFYQEASAISVSNCNGGGVLVQFIRVDFSGDMTWYYKNKTELKVQQKYTVENHLFTTNNKGEFIDARMSSSLYNVMCVGADGVAGPEATPELYAQEEKQSLGVYENEESGVDIISFEVQQYMPSAKLVYGVFVSDTEICHGAVLDNGSFYCVLDDVLRTGMRV